MTLVFTWGAQEKTFLNWTGIVPSPGHWVKLDGSLVGRVASVNWEFTTLGATPTVRVVLE